MEDGSSTFGSGIVCGPWVTVWCTGWADSGGDSNKNKFFSDSLNSIFHAFKDPDALTGF